MFSGGDSSGDGVNKFSNFAANVAACGGLNINPNSSIDWAQLAKQWIQMRDSHSGADIGGGTGHTMPDAPPPPNISVSNTSVPSSAGRAGVAKMKSSAPSTQQHKKAGTYEEQGEADMDMDDDEEHHSRKLAENDSPPPPAPSMQLSGEMPLLLSPAELMHRQWFIPEVNAAPGTDLAAAAQQTSPAAQWNAWPPRVALPPPGLHVPTLPNPTAHIPSLMKISVPHPNAIKEMPETADASSASDASTMDAAKRKILPAWIREGLEKMEREKLKQLEREQQQVKGGGATTEDQAATKITTLFPQETMVNNYTTTVMESESSGNEEADELENTAAAYAASRPTFNGPHVVQHSANDDDSDVEGAERLVGKSYEQRVADLMIVVRRTLTELLLEVTNEEISTVAHEAIKSSRAKASSVEVIRKSALSSITGKLGLAAYADSSSSGESSTSEHEASDNDDDDNSEEEIRAIIRAKRRAFAQVSEDIEERIAENALREEEKLKFHTKAEQERLDEVGKAKSHRSGDKHERHRSGGTADREVDTERGSGGGAHRQAQSSANAQSGNVYGRDNEFGETTESKLQHSNGKRQRERSTRKERTTRFSDNKDSKSSSIAVAASYISQLQQSNTAGASSSGSSNAAALTSANVASNMLQQLATGRQTDANSLYLMTAAQSSYGTSGMSNILSAADIALEKAAASRSSKSSSSHARADKHQRHHRHSSDDDRSDSDTASNSSRTSSKYSRASSSKRYKKDDRSSSSRYYHKSSSSSSKRTSERSERERERERDRERERGSGGSSRRHHHRRRHSSDSDDNDDDDYHRSSRSSSQRHKH